MEVEICPPLTQKQVTSMLRSLFAELMSCSDTTVVASEAAGTDVAYMLYSASSQRHALVSD